MREIKFRCWSKTEKEFDYGILAGNILAAIHGSGDPLSEDEEEWYTLQQYTGLKDSEGKEIYEGDIVSGYFYDTDVMADLPTIAPVIWNDERTCFNVGHYYWRKYNIKIVGNIFENPELLN